MKYLARTLCLAVIAAALSPAAHAQATMYDGMLQQALRQSQNLTQQMNSQMNGMLQQAMQNPQVQSSYQQYLQQMQQRGGQPMDFQTYAYYYMYTRGFTDTQTMRQNESNIQQKEMQAWRGVQQAEQNRAQVMQDGRNHYYQNQQEAGRGLMGQSTYYGQGGYQNQLPHTWQSNTYNQYQGNWYYVDQSGQYYRVDQNGYHYPLNR